MLACGLTHAAVTPLDLVKTRRQVDAKLYRSNFQGWGLIYRAEGVRGLYFGGAVTALRDAVGYGFYFWSYELATRWMATRPGGGGGEEDSLGGEAARVRGAGEDTWIVSGMLRPDELADVVGWSFPESDVYETLAGYIVAELQRLANVGDAITCDEWHLIVTRVDGRWIAEVRVVRPPKVPAAVEVDGTESPV